MRFTESPELVCAIDPVTSSTSMTSTFEISSFAVQFADNRNSSLPNMNINSVGKTADACPATYEAFMACEEKRMPDAPYLRTEERSVGKACVSTFRYRMSHSH